MKNPWNAEFRIDKKLARSLIESQFPELIPVSLEFIGEGWDNVVYRVNHHYVFRFPRRQHGADLVEIEWKILPQLVERLPIAIPEPLFYGKPTAEFQWHFLGYSYLPGTSAYKIHLTTDGRTHLAKPLAEFLKALHSIKITPELTFETSPHVTNKLDIEKRFPIVLENIHKIKALNIFDQCDKLLEMLESIKDIRDPGAKRLVYGDLSAVHMLIDKNKNLCGIIDWGDIHIGNPASDLEILFEFLPPAGRAIFLETYGKISKETEQLALFRALYHTAFVVLFAHDIQEKDVLKEALTGLELIVQNQEHMAP